MARTKQWRRKKYTDPNYRPVNKAAAAEKKRKRRRERLREARKKHRVDLKAAYERLVVGNCVGSPAADNNGAAVEQVVEGLVGAVALLDSYQAPKNTSGYTGKLHARRGR